MFDKLRIFFSNALFFLSTITSVITISIIVPVVSHAASGASDFARLPAISHPALSPDGESIAFEFIHEGKPAVIIKDLNKEKPKHKVGALPLNGAHLQWLHWANNERLIVAIRLNGERRGRNYNFVRIFSVDRYGLNPVYFDMEPNKWGYSLFHPWLVDMLWDDPDHVLLALDVAKDSHWDAAVHKVNINTGKKTLVEANRRGFHYYLPDNNGDIKLAVVYGTGKGADFTLFQREDASAPWQIMQKANVLSRDALYPIRFDYEDQNILILSTAKLEDDDFDQDDSDLYKYDLRTKKIIGEYVHEPREAAKKALEKAFPGRRVRLVSWLDDIHIGKGIYRVYGDIYPDQYFLYDTEAKRADFIASAYPHLEGRTLSPTRLVSYKARDGLDIPAYLTLPSNAQSDKNASETKPATIPFIVMPHGGPWARDTWRFNPYVQYFVSLGYGVIQPQFRGSTGFGYDHFKAGFQQWGLKIQDDISDATKWVVQEGLAAPDKICIVGGSFGGYAAAMGLAKTPELFTCGVSINGVLDMKLFSKHSLWYDKIEQELVNSKYNLKKVSPYHLHKNIVDPLLLVVGDKDSVVAPEHSYKMEKALKKKNRDVTLVSLPNAEHWRTDEASEIQSLTAIGAFLQKHLSITAGERTPQK